MKHYSIQAVDIFIQEIVSIKGWHLGDIVQYQVNNCAWESRVELQPKARPNGSYELQGKQVFENGDREKMLNDQAITFMVIQAHISQAHQEAQLIKWVN